MCVCFSVGVVGGMYGVLYDMLCFWLVGSVVCCGFVMSGECCEQK